MINIISISYLSDRVSGPKKVVDNLIKGLDLLGYPYVVNRRLDACQRLWIHDDLRAMEEAKHLGPEIKIVAGPNLYLLPRLVPKSVSFSNIVLSHPSAWIRDFWQDFGFHDCPIEVCPAGIDTEEFRPGVQKKDLVLVYFKQRSPEELAIVESALREKSLAYKVLVYGHYKESVFKEMLGRARYAIWIGRHESQGIALEETLSSNVPILLCDVTNLGQWSASPKEMAVFNSQENLYTKATSAAYFDSSCGLRISDLKLFPSALAEMENTYKTFTPRRYVEQHLNLRKQAEGFLEIYQKYYGLTIAQGYKETLLKSGDWINRSWLFRLKVTVKDLIKSFL